MVTKTYKFTINYPDQLYRFRWENLKKYVSWLNNSPECYCCGKKLNFKRPEVKYKFPQGTHLTVNWSTDYKKSIHFCKECLSQVVAENVIQPAFGEDFYDYDISPVCQLNQCDAPSFKHFKITFMKQEVSFRMCVNSWNSSKICLQCVSQALRYGEESSSHWGQYKDMSVPLNDYRLPVVDGKVRFPW